MRNQTSFRLTTTLLPSDTTANTTTVINKVDASGNKFYPTFTEETVVITNDDRTVMETTRAVCTNWVLTFVKRGLSDDSSATPVDNRKLTWNPWSLCFITAWAWDWIDKDDDITWTGKQIYTGDMESRWKATYKWELITEKWVKYPHFDNVADLEAYSGAFGGMFAVVDSTWELYRYNAVTEERALIESSQPANPEMADDETIWTVRIATDAEFAAWTDTGSQWEYLVPTPSQVKSVSPENNLHITHVNIESTRIYTSWSSASITYQIPKAWFIKMDWKDHYINDWDSNPTSIVEIAFSWTASAVQMSSIIPYKWNALIDTEFRHKDIVAVSEWSLTITISLTWNIPSWSVWVWIVDYIYFW